MHTDNNIDIQQKDMLKKYVYDVLGCCQEVHKELGCWLNEYVYQDALAICLTEKAIPFEKEWHFASMFHGVPLRHEHQLDFLIRDNVIIECKAVKELATEHRQQLWNYMRLTQKPIGILYNFAPQIDQCEKYFYNPHRNTIQLF